MVLERNISRVGGGGGGGGDIVVPGLTGANHFSGGD